jgi:hypothetical protein
MPLPRWWPSKTGRPTSPRSPDSTDPARLIFLEFALVFSNDWYQVPCYLPSGTVTRILGLTVADVFGHQQWIAPTGAGPDENRQRWSTFTLDTIDTPGTSSGERVPRAVCLERLASVCRGGNGGMQEIALADRGSDEQRPPHLRSARRAVPSP